MSSLLLSLPLMYAIILVCTVTSCFSADSLQSLKEKGKSYYWGTGGEQSYIKALQFYLLAAEAGDAEAQYISGGMYLKGMGVNKDFRKAFTLLHQAAQNGKSTAESEQILGQAFLLGAGVPKNYQKALQWYTLAADNGSKEAQNELGFMYFVGNGVEQDAEKGGEYFMKAAYNGLPVAQYNVGIMYYTGRGVKAVDLQKSYAWLNIAAANGHQAARAAREYLETTMTKSELTAAQAFSEELTQSITRQDG